jgi:hypothetical protein
LSICEHVSKYSNEARKMSLFIYPCVLATAKNLGMYI